MSLLIRLSNVEQLITITHPNTLSKESFIGNSVESQWTLDGEPIVQGKELLRKEPKRWLRLSAVLIAASF